MALPEPISIGVTIFVIAFRLVSVSGFGVVVVAVVVVSDFVLIYNTYAYGRQLKS